MMYSIMENPLWSVRGAAVLFAVDCHARRGQRFSLSFIAADWELLR